MTTHRRYTTKEKLSAVLAADMVGLTAAAEQSGIPKSTLVYWLERPEFAQFRTSTREAQEDGVRVVAQLAWQRVAERLQRDEMEPRDILFAAEKASNVLMLLGGEATSRTETRSITDGYDDTEKQRLRDFIDGLAGDAAGPADEGSDTERAGAEVR
jgi:hypothetical protein